jgi:hypothetical protein
MPLLAKGGQGDIISLSAHPRRKNVLACGLGSFQCTKCGGLLILKSTLHSPESQFVHLVQNSCHEQPRPAKKPRNSLEPDAVDSQPAASDAGYIEENIPTSSIVDNQAAANAVVQEVIKAAQGCDNGTVLKVTAVAGAGKTTLLLEYIRNLTPGARVLVVMFNNKPVQDFAELLDEEKIQVEVEVMTSSKFSGGTLAYCPWNASGIELNCKCFALHTPHTPPDYHDDCAACQFFLGKCMVEFLKSPSKRPLLEHCTPFANSNTCAKKLHAALQVQWKQIVDGWGEGDQAITFDMGMKILQANQGELRERLEEYDHILVDEAQDCTPCELEVLCRPQAAQITLVVGDPLQCINQFRGASSNGFDRIHATHRFELPCSFRYGYPLNKIVQSVMLPSRPGFVLNTASTTGTETFQVHSVSHAVALCPGDLHCIFRYTNLPDPTCTASSGTKW